MTDNRKILSNIKALGKTILPKDGAMWLYGSRARGTEHADSDWDILILLNKDKEEFEDFDRYAFPLIDMGAQIGAVVSAQIYTQKEWKSMSFSPFVKNVEQDKIVLYGTK